ncbi:MAG: DUF3467 domain-containing protein [Anaerolineaceae bacterium]|nr:DUF3467 domain-containing protein [Anaerolineaceae bacterium]
MAEIRPIEVQLPESLAPVFANMVRVSHTPGEFILDFTAILPGTVAPKVSSRIILSPLGLKMMEQAILENLRRYEANFGEIKITAQHSLADDLFGRNGQNPEEKK